MKKYQHLAHKSSSVHNGWMNGWSVLLFLKTQDQIKWKLFLLNTCDLYFLIQKLKNFPIKNLILVQLLGFHITLLEMIKT